MIAGPELYDTVFSFETAAQVFVTGIGKNRIAGSCPFRAQVSVAGMEVVPVRVTCAVAIRVFYLL